MKKKYRRRVCIGQRIFWFEWQKGYKNHCFILAKRFGLDDKWSSSGRASIALKKEDLP